MDYPLATLDTIDGKPVLRFVRRLAHAQAKVWRAVTDPDEMAHWFPARISTELRVGAPMRFSFGDEGLDGGEQWAQGEILELDPPKVYAFRWYDSVIRIELVPDGAGCVLHFSETLGGVGTHGDRASVARQAPGWEACLLALGARLDGGPAPTTDSAWFLAHAERYVEEFGLGEGEAHETADGFVVRFERDLVPNHDEVWGLLTEDTAPAVGGAPPVRFTHGYTTAATITAVEPGRVLEYGYLDGDDVAGRVRFELRHQEPLGTRLVVTQTVPARRADTLAVTLAAWQTHLELLFAALYGDVRCPWPAARTDELTKRYAERLDARYATLTAATEGRHALRFERRLPHSAEKVWRALTEARALNEWFAAVVDRDLAAGTEVRFDLTDEARRRLEIPEGTDLGSTGRVTVFEPPRVLEYTWGEEVLRWELSPAAGGCVLVFTDVVPSADGAADMAAGWHACLEVLVAWLDGHPVDWSPWDRLPSLTERYAARLA